MEVIFLYALYWLYWLVVIVAFIVLYLVASQVLRKPKIDKPLHLDKPQQPDDVNQKT